jgi:hypothetical protein
MLSVLVRPAARVRGRRTVPGDKSISHRYAILAALADGTSTITRYAPGADCASTLSCLAALGVTISGPGGAPEAQPDQRVLTVRGRGLGGLRPPQGPLDAGNSGTTRPFVSSRAHSQATTSRASSRATPRSVGDQCDGSSNPSHVWAPRCGGTTTAPHSPSGAPHSTASPRRHPSRPLTPCFWPDSMLPGTQS